MLPINKEYRFISTLCTTNKKEHKFDTTIIKNAEIILKLLSIMILIFVLFAVCTFCASSGTTEDDKEWEDFVKILFENE